MVRGTFIIGKVFLDSGKSAYVFCEACWILGSVWILGKCFWIAEVLWILGKPHSRPQSRHVLLAAGSWARGLPSCEGPAG